MTVTPTTTASGVVGTSGEVSREDVLFAGGKGAKRDPAVCNYLSELIPRPGRSACRRPSAVRRRRCIPSGRTFWSARASTRSRSISTRSTGRGAWWQRRSGASCSSAHGTVTRHDRCAVYWIGDRPLRSHAPIEASDVELRDGMMQVDERLMPERPGVFAGGDAAPAKPHGHHRGWPRSGRGDARRRLAARARRCLSCGTCFACDDCFGMCPDSAVINIGNGGPGANAVDLEHCKGCGICAQECPAGAIVMEPEEI